MSDNTNIQAPDAKRPEIVSAERRAALAKLGLGIGVAYLAPTVLRIDRSAHAMGPSCANNPKFCT
jgi:hypothetical protein